MSRPGSDSFGGEVTGVPGSGSAHSLGRSADTPASAARRLVFVVGSGRSGTSTMSGTLQMLGLHVPQPEVFANATNPKGFGEPRWVVDLHKRLLQRSRVMTSDARPSAWSDADRLSNLEPLQARVHAWLEEQFAAGGDELVIKDPRIAWFVGLWRAAALGSGAVPAYVTMLRPVTEVVGSKAKHYKPRFGEVHAVAAWVNMMLHTEHSTRGSVRVFVRYDDLLSDWTVPLFDIGERFGLATVKSATSEHINAVHEFIDPSLRRVRHTWDDVHVPPRLREIAEESWRALDTLAGAEGDVADTHVRLDEVRAAYVALYQESEAITQSTVNAARRRAPARKAQRRPRNPAKGQAAGSERTGARLDRSALPRRAGRRLGTILGDKG